MVHLSLFLEEPFHRGWGCRREFALFGQNRSLVEEAKKMSFPEAGVPVKIDLKRHVHAGDDQLLRGIKTTLVIQAEPPKSLRIFLVDRFGWFATKAEIVDDPVQIIDAVLNSGGL